MTVARLSVFALQYFYDNLTIDRSRRHSCPRRSTSGCCSHFVMPAADALTVAMATRPPFRTLCLTLSRVKVPREPLAEILGRNAAAGATSTEAIRYTM
jgi:hypothetical protein